MLCGSQGPSSSSGSSSSRKLWLGFVGFRVSCEEECWSERRGIKKFPRLFEGPGGSGVSPRDLRVVEGNGAIAVARSDRKSVARQRRGQGRRWARKFASLVACDEGLDLSAPAFPIVSGLDGGVVVEEEGVRQLRVAEARDSSGCGASTRDCSCAAARGGSRRRSSRRCTSCRSRWCSSGWHGARDLVSGEQRSIPPSPLRGCFPRSSDSFSQAMRGG